MWCSLCARKFTTLSMLLKHIHLVHADKPNFNIQCNIHGCKRTFRRFNTFRNHVYQHHDVTCITDFQPELESSEAESSEAESSEAESETSSSDEWESSPNVETDVDSSNYSIEEAVESMRKTAGLWMLKTREKHKIPLSVMDEIILDVQELFLSAVRNIHMLLESELPNDDSIKSKVSECLDSSSPLLDIFSGLKTQQQQINYFEKELNMIVPVQTVLGTRRVHKHHGQKRRLIEKKDVMVYVPLLKTIQTLLQDDGILTEIKRGHLATETGTMEDICDGEGFISHPLFSAPEALQILFYYDDVEVCNPLQSSRLKHKLGLFYFTLGNVRPQFRSKMKMINLVAACKQNYIKKYGMDSILNPFIEDLKKLEAGYTFLTADGPQHFRGTIAAISADNPASSSLGGFKESGSAHRPCRQCMGTREETKEEFVEELFTLRTLLEHKQHCAEIQSDQAASTQWGVNRQSVLLDLDYFDVCDSLLPDVMHDLLEGCLQYEAKLLLQYCIEEKYFTRKTLNRLIEAYDLGYANEADRPSPIPHSTLYSADNLLKQKAIQMWTLGRFLPAIIGKYIPEDDRNWINYLNLLHITDYLLAPKISHDEVSHLKFLIEEHHTEFCQVYPTASVIPKLHYLIHTPRLIMRFGPLSRQWTMRYEAKHSYFKKIAQHTGNFINISWTVSMRHQMLQCYEHSDSSDSFLDTTPDIGPGYLVAERDLPAGIDGETSCYKAKWVKANGQCYKNSCTLVIGCQNEYPTFAELQYIYITGEVLFDVLVFETTGYNFHHHGYVLEKTSQHKIVALTDLIDHVPLHTMRVAQTKTLVVVKYHICNTIWH